MAHKFALLALDALAMLFWFATWVALAVFRDDLFACYGRICDTLTAGIVFGAFTWYVMSYPFLVRWGWEGLWQMGDKGRVC